MSFSNGNSWDPKVTLACVTCGMDKLCVICHRHAKKRGECDECPPEKPIAPVVK
jgi:hypothetical protein